MERAVETAYKAVMKPKEGTILTVAKEAALKAAEIAPEAEELEPFFKEIFEHAEYTLSRTPEMLPVLKKLVSLIQVDRDSLKYCVVQLTAFSAKKLITLNLRNLQVLQ